MGFVSSFEIPAFADYDRTPVRKEKHHLPGWDTRENMR
jgi:hypothetical protein